MDTQALRSGRAVGGLKELFLTLMRAPTDSSPQWKNNYAESFAKLTKLECQKG